MKDGFLNTLSRIFVNSMALGATLVLATLIVKGFGKIDSFHYFTMVIVSFVLTTFMIVNFLRFVQKYCGVEQKK